MLSEGATSALDASKVGRCLGWDVRIRFGRNRQRDGRGGRNKETGEANLTANMPPKGTTGIKCRGKGQKRGKMRENDKKRAECLHMSKKSSTFVPKLRKYAHCVRVK